MSEPPPTPPVAFEKKLPPFGSATVPGPPAPPPPPGSAPLPDPPSPNPAPLSGPTGGALALPPPWRGYGNAPRPPPPPPPAATATRALACGPAANHAATAPPPAPPEPPVPEPGAGGGDTARTSPSPTTTVKLNAAPVPPLPPPAPPPPLPASASVARQPPGGPAKSAPDAGTLTRTVEPVRGVTGTQRTVANPGVPPVPEVEASPVKDVPPRRTTPATLAFKAEAPPTPAADTEPSVPSPLPSAAPPPKLAARAARPFAPRLPAPPPPPPPPAETSREAP